MPMQVLIVDDEESICDIFARYGVKQGWQVTTSTRPHEVLASFRPHHFQVAFIDVDQRDGVDGVEYALKLRELDPSLRIVMMSGDIGNDSRVETAALGPMLEKPFSLMMLDARVKLQVMPK